MAHLGALGEDQHRPAQEKQLGTLRLRQGIHHIIVAVRRQHLSPAVLCSETRKRIKSSVIAAATRKIATTYAINKPVPRSSRLFLARASVSY